MRKSPYVWIFDLDNTLHNASAHIFPHINLSMRRYMEAHLQLSKEEAHHLRQHYWQRYGATLLGLMRHHQIDPRHFLQETHQFPELASMVVFNRAVRAMLRRLPGRKILYSNGPSEYARGVMDITRLTPLFDAIYTVESTRFRPKPSLAGFHQLLRNEKLDPRRCIMVEDSAENLRAAKRLGMKTVWISRSQRCPAYVDARMNSVLALPSFLRRHQH